MKGRLRGLGKKISATAESASDYKKILGAINGLASICRLGINEILFSYWHILHLPLFILLVISGFVHVVVVHFY